MSAPTNLTLATATDVGILNTSPTTLMQDVHDAGTTYTVWYAYTAVTGDTELGVFGFGALAAYQPTITFWLDATTQYLNNNAQNRPTQIPITPGTTYYMKFTTNSAVVSPAVLTLRLQIGAQQQLSAGLLAINDSTDGYPAVIMDPTSGEPVAFVHPFAAGEGVCVLTSGIVCAIDVAADGVKIYDQELTLLVTPTMPAAGYNDCLGTNQRETFWVGNNGGGIVHAFMVAMDQQGTFGTPLDLGSAGLTSLTPLADNSIVYFTKNESSTNQAVFQITNPGGVITTFKAGVVGKFFGANLMMLTNDTILIPYEESGVDTIIRRYNAAGVEQTGSPITLSGTTTGIERIFADPDDPTYFWVWWQTSVDNRFQKITTATGAVTTDLTWPKFIEGDYQDAQSATPAAYFGADFSCVPWILRGTAETETFTIRRQRRWLLPQSESNKRMQIPLMELLMRTGIGLLPDAAGSSTPLGVDPEVRLRISKDGGKTWGPERARSGGVRGEFRDRVRWTRATGNYRNGVGELTCDAPVDWQWLSVMGDPTEGSS